MRRLRVIAVALACVLLAACAGVPTSGPVQKVEDRPDAGLNRGIDITPAPPMADASMDAVVFGFLSAMAAPEPGYSAARQYLTPRAARTWEPAAGVTVYQGEGYQPTFTADTAVLRAPVVGRVDRNGRYTSLYQADFSYDFDLTRTDGQWRINNPPAGLLLTQFFFERFYQPHPVYFLDPTGRMLAPELVYLSDARVTPTAVVETLLRGPSQWLAPAVMTAFPAGTRLDGITINVARGVAEVSLDGELARLGQPQRVQLAAQLLWTLSPFSEIAGVRITLNGFAYPVRTRDPLGVLDLADVAGFRPMDANAITDAYAVREGVLGRVQSAAGTVFTPVTGAFGTPAWKGRIGSIAVDPGNDRAVAVTGDRRTAVLAPLTAVGAGVPVLSGTSLGAPQLMADGTVWAFDTPAGGASVLVRSGGGTLGVRVPVPALLGGTVVAFRVSPDRTRMAVIVQRDGARRLGLLRITGGDSPLLDAWRPLEVSTDLGRLTSLRDVAWSGESTLLVLGAIGVVTDQQHSTYRLSVDGATVSSIGPSGDVDAVQLAAQPRAAGTAALITTADQRLLRYEDRSRWVRVEAGVTAACFAE